MTSIRDYTLRNQSTAPLLHCLQCAQKNGAPQMVLRSAFRSDPIPTAGLFFQRQPGGFGQSIEVGTGRRVVNGLNHVSW